MISSASENATLLFAEIGVDPQGRDTATDLVIDWFDHWSDQGRPEDRMTLCQCAIPVEEEKAA